MMQTLLLVVPAVAFTVRTPQPRTTTALHMGLFDGVKEAFVAPSRSSIDSERETPIDRWMGWSVVSDRDEAAAAVAQEGEI